MSRIPRFVAALAVMACATAAAQSPQGAKLAPKVADPATKLRQALPADVADRVLARIAAARSRGLPGAALENRALKFASRGVKPADIEKSIYAQADRMDKSKSAIESGRGGKARGDEIEAGAEAMRKGVDGAKVSELAKSAPSGRSLAVPLFVVGSLVDRGLPSDSALLRVQARLQQKASDRELEELPGQVTRGTPATNGGKGGKGGKGPAPSAAASHPVPPKKP